ncbi:MAG: flagellar export protein FliJ [Terracidiphilus sp.]
MSFRFPLAAVLLVRENAEQREERALKKLQLEMSHASHQLAQLNAEIANLQAARERTMEQPIPAIHLYGYEQQAREVAEKKKTLANQMQKLRQELAEQMKLYQAAHRDREALTDMLQKQREAYEQEQSREQQKQLDDLFMARRHRS